MGEGGDGPEDADRGQPSGEQREHDRSAETHPVQEGGRRKPLGEPSLSTLLVGSFSKKGRDRQMDRETVTDRQIIGRETDTDGGRERERGK